MSKRLLSDEPNTPKSLKELFWENAEKARMGEFWKDKKSYKELSEATGIPSGSLRMLFMNKPKANIPKIVTITNGLAEGEVRERMTDFVVSSGMAQTNYNLINQTGTVSLDTLEKFSKRLRVEPYELLATIKTKGDC